MRMKAEPETGLLLTCVCWSTHADRFLVRKYKRSRAEKVTSVAAPVGHLRNISVLQGQTLIHDSRCQ